MSGRATSDMPSHGSGEVALPLGRQAEPRAGVCAQLHPIGGTALCSSIGTLSEWRDRSVLTPTRAAIRTGTRGRVNAGPGPAATSSPTTRATDTARTTAMAGGNSSPVGRTDHRHRLTGRHRSVPPSRAYQLGTALLGHRTAVARDGAGKDGRTTVSRTMRWTSPSSRRAPSLPMTGPGSPSAGPPALSGRR